MKSVVYFSVLMSCWVKTVVNFSVHVMLGDVVVTFSVHVMLGDVSGYLLCSCHVGWSLWLPSLFMSCWVKSGVTFSVYVMLGEVCGYLLCSCHVG